VGGVGSGGHNRKSAEQHKRLGNFRPSRHARGELVQLRGGLADLPEPPAGLGEAGLQLWRDAWSTMPWPACSSSPSSICAMGWSSPS
jgi:hypothetical protein